MLKTMTLFIIVVAPSNRVRIFLYRHLCECDIDYSCRIGFGNILRFGSYRLRGASAG